jgi:DNA mismatch repair protein MutL
MKLNLPSGDLKERISLCYPSDYQREQLVLLEQQWEDFSLKVVAAPPEIRRRDRKHIQIYANRRRIDEYAFIQAVEYGFDSYLPGGAFPVAFVFIEVLPHLVDFNIHPAKREARFHIKQKIHHGLVELIKGWLQRENYHYSAPLLQLRKNKFDDSQHSLNIPQTRDTSRNSLGYSTSLRDPGYSLDSSSIHSSNSIYKNREQWKTQGKSPGSSSLAQNIQPMGNPLREVAHNSRDFQYLGQIFDLFLLVVIDQRLLIMDQHAAHERILYDLYRGKASSVQELLIPQELELEKDEEEFLEQTLDQWKSMGFHITKDSPGNWLITTVPQYAQRLNLNLIEVLRGCGGNNQRLEKELYAQLACKSAIKDGEVLDRVTAEELIEKALELPEPRCPHGRPLWFELSREELFQLLGRDV